MNDKQQIFVNRILHGALEAQKEYGVMASLTLAQAILESAWGKSSIGNNIFGIKANAGWRGAKQCVPTTEYVGGKKISVNAYFRDYGSVDESITDHAKLLTMPRYKAVIAAKDYKEACKAVQNCGYATDPNYADKLISLIETNQLNKWDCASNVKPSVSNETKPTAEGLKVGDMARINANATTYSTGEKIPSSVKIKRYTIAQVKPDRVLLKEIMSWVYIKDMTRA